jgi:hypothetical protein
MNETKKEQLLNSLKYCAVTVILNDGRSFICTTCPDIIEAKVTDSSVEVAKLSSDGKMTGKTIVSFCSVSDFHITPINNKFYINKMANVF